MPDARYSKTSDTVIRRPPNARLAAALAGLDGDSGAPVHTVKVRPRHRGVNGVRASLATARRWRGVWPGGSARRRLVSTIRHVDGESRRRLGSLPEWSVSHLLVGHDLDEPPHIHVDRDDQSAKFWLAPVALARNLGFTAVELGRVQRLVAEHEPRLLEAWNEYVRGSAG